jgi:hypothetical protein
MPFEATLILQLLLELSDVLIDGIKLIKEPLRFLPGKSI